LTIGPTLVRTLRHFFPRFNEYLDDIDDPRLEPNVSYDKRFLLWWGLALFLLKLGSRRQLDFQLGRDGPQVLHNLNRLADTDQDTCPVHNTLNYFLGRIGSAPLVTLRQRLMQRLIRMKAVDAARLQGHLLVLIDGTGYLVFRYRHCDHCLTQRHGDQVLYLHQVLEGKLLGPADTVLSLATTFIDNRDALNQAGQVSVEQFKQDCELKALRRMARQLRQSYPQLRLCLVGDGLFACGEGFQVAKDYHLSFLYTFQPGRLPSVWQDFQALLKENADCRVEVETPTGSHQVYRWVHALSYTDSHGRRWSFTAVECRERHRDGKEERWAWVTDLEVNHETVVEVVWGGGRKRWCIENQGFNTQKNSGLNLEHAYSHGEQWSAYYYLLQIAHLLLQLVEKGSLLRQLAGQQGYAGVLEWFGSLKNMAERLRESLRFLAWPAEAFSAEWAGKIQIRLDSS
jgi:hypothetical protein